MAQDSNIEWTNKVWNPTRGCSRVSPGCGGPNHEGGCYAEKIAARFSGPGQAYQGLAERTTYGGRWTGEVRLIKDMLAEPFHWRDPQKIFVNSMSDLFHDALPTTDIAEVFGVMAVAGQVFLSGAKTLVYGYRYDPPGSANKRPLRSYGQKFGPHIFQVLTKRGDRMRQLVNSPAFRHAVASAAHRHAHDRVCAGELSDAISSGSRWPLPGVWLGISVEDRARKPRIDDLRATPAAVRFISFEPLLEDLGDVDLTGIHQAITGGESGHRRRPHDVEWQRSILRQCRAQGVAFFAKQDDKVRPLPPDLMIREFPKVAA